MLPFQRPHRIVILFCFMEKAERCSFYPQHPVADADVRLYVLLPVFPIFQLFAQSCHKYPQGGNIVFPTAAPNLLRDVGMRQNLAHIFGEQAQQLVFDSPNSPAGTAFATTAHWLSRSTPCFADGGLT